MAAATVRSEATVVAVVSPVALSANLRHIRPVRDGFTVTVAATQFAVSSGKRKTGFRLVIEHDSVPGRSVVAGVTLASHRIVMNVIGSMTVHAGSRRVMESVGLMAVCTDGILVPPEQREPGKPVIEPYRGSPAILAMAIGAGGAELTDVRVIVRVTRSAFAIDRFIARTGVTRRACERNMGSAQRKITDKIVIESGVRPARYPMTASAVAAQIALMNVIRRMAALAQCTALCGKIVAFVACRASQIVVAAGQSEAGQAEMIEFQIIPINGGVTLLAVRAVPALVDIIGAMTVDALVRGIRKNRALVTTLTACAGMRARQQKTGQVMVKPCAGPFVLGMTVATSRTELPAMPVILLMTPNAFARRLGINEVRRMTGLAGQPPVCTFEQKIR